MNATQISTAEDESSSQNTAASVGSSAALISFFVIISRITGFMRTWAMAFALGSTMLASSYQIANNLPNMLYELVMGGMLVTAFLPVYLSVKNRLGERGGNEYASNIMSIAFIALGLVALLCTLFAPALVFTQSFMSDQGGMDDAVFFFRFFAIQIVFYGLSSIVSGLLNASRDYLWSSAAPIFNNIIVTATFVLYAFIAPDNPDMAKLVIAIGNPLGVFVQMAIQLPALKRNGVKLRFRIDLRDPALKETLAIGIPAVLVMCAGLIVVSVQNAASYATVDNGPSIIAYARLWFTLPYAFLTVPITTAMFTEISEMHAKGDMKAFKRGVASGTNQILFFMVPFALFLVVFAEPLVTLYHIGAFTEENIAQIAVYLAALAVSLPFYGVNTYLQKAFSAMRLMGSYAAMMVAAIALQIAFIAVFATPFGGALDFGMPAIALSETVFYVVLDLACFAFLRRRIGPLGLKSMAVSLLRSLALGVLGAAAAAAVVFVLDATVLPLNGSIPHALGCIVCGGVVGVAITFGIAVKTGMQEASMLVSIVDRIASRLGRGRKNTQTADSDNGSQPTEIPANAVEAWNEPVAQARDGRSRQPKDDERALSHGEHAYRAADAAETHSTAPAALRGRHAGGATPLLLHGESEERIPRGRHSAHAVFERKVAGARHVSTHNEASAAQHGRHAAVGGQVPRAQNGRNGSTAQGRHARTDAPDCPASPAGIHADEQRTGRHAAAPEKRRRGK